MNNFRNMLSSFRSQTGGKDPVGPPPTCTLLGHPVPDGYFESYSPELNGCGRCNCVIPDLKDCPDVFGQWLGGADDNVDESTCNCNFQSAGCVMTGGLLDPTIKRPSKSKLPMMRSATGFKNQLGGLDDLMCYFQSVYGGMEDFIPGFSPYSGCTDSRADNFNADACYEDMSCTFSGPYAEVYSQEYLMSASPCQFVCSTTSGGSTTGGGITNSTFGTGKDPKGKGKRRGMRSATGGRDIDGFLGTDKGTFK